VSQIRIVDLEVFYRVGVSRAERAAPQRLLLTIEMNHDFAKAARSDRLSQTIDYHALAQRLLTYGKGRSWKLLESLVWELADFILAEYRPQSVFVEVKKYPLPQARHVAVSLTQSRPLRPGRTAT
jgi:FolB domain-containing protein